MINIIWISSKRFKKLTLLLIRKLIILIKTINIKYKPKIKIVIQDQIQEPLYFLILEQGVVHQGSQLCLIKGD